MMMREGEDNVDEALAQIVDDDALDPVEPLRVLYRHCRAHPKASVRDLLNATTTSNNTATTLLLVEPFMERLVEYMDDRAVVPMPATQDEATVDETYVPPLTILSGLAGAVYADLIARPGAWVTLQGVSALENVLRRWRLMQSHHGGTTTTTTTGGNHRDDDFSADDDENEPNEEDDAATKDWGLAVATAVCRVPSQNNEFRKCWNMEAVERTWVCISMALATAHSLRIELDVSFRECFSDLDELEQPLSSFHESNGGEETEPSIDDADEISDPYVKWKERQRQMLVAILRGFYPVLLRQEILPHGEAGKIAAATACSASLRVLIAIICRLPRTTDSTPPNFTTTTTTTPSPNHDAAAEAIDKTTPPRRALQYKTTTPRTLPKTPISSRRKLLTPKAKNTPQRVTPSSQHIICPLRSAIVGLLQRLATSTELQKAAVRNTVVESIHSCTMLLQDVEADHLASFWKKLCRSKVAIHRLVAVELLKHVLLTERNAPTTNDNKKNDRARHCAVLETIQGRVLDKIANVRIAACNCIATAAQSIADADTFHDLADLKDILLRRSNEDVKAAVRRAASLALVEVIVRTDDINADDVAALALLCRDEAVMTRRSAAEGLTRLVELFPDSCSKAWSDAVLNMALDSACSAKALEMIDRLILQPILSKQGDEELAWKILGALDCGFGHAHTQTEALRAAMQSSINANLFRILRSNVLEALENGNVDRLIAVWRLVDAVAGADKDRVATTKMLNRLKLDFGFLGTSLARLLDLQAPVECVKKCLRAWTRLSGCVKDGDVREQTAEKLMLLLSNFDLPAQLISAAISALTAITVAADKDENEQHHALSAWITVLYGACEERLAGMHGRALGDKDFQIISRVILTAGELCLIGFSPSEDQGPNADRAVDSSVLACGFLEKPPKQLINHIQSHMTRELPGYDCMKIPEPIRALAFLTIGKISFRDSALAKRSLNMFAQELEHKQSGQCWNATSNALIVLSDLCVRYTNMADKFLPNMAACLQAGIHDFGSENNLLGCNLDGSENVRRHAVLALSGLLLQDYIKWRGLLFHRFLVATVDADEDVSQLAEAAINGPLLLKQPNLFSTHFVESIFVLNRCTAHPIYQAAAVAGDGGSGIIVGFDGINLTGEFGRLCRFKIYEMMLSKMTDEEKIQTAARIGKEVFGSSLKNGSELNRFVATDQTAASEARESSMSVMSDALALISNPKMRVSYSLSKEDDEIEDPNISVDKTKRAVKAKGKLLSNISKKHLVEILLPTLCHLKALLQKHKSPLFKDVMVCLLDVFQRHKNEAKECLANEPTTLQELEFDARQSKKNATN